MQRLIKTLFEYLIAISCIFVLSPLLLFLAILIKLDSSGPVIHRRHVIGRNGRSFGLLKLRTTISDQLDGTYHQEIRITRLGKVLRKLNWDEIPCLFNVILGDVSLVGPCLLSPSQARLHDQKYLKRLLVIKPGLISPSQTFPYNTLPEELLGVELDYVENWSLQKDISLLFKKIQSLFSPRGAY